MTPSRSIIGKVKRGVEKVAFGNLLYQKFLMAGEHPERLFFTPPDLWPGDAQAGMALLAAQRSMFDMLGEGDSTLANPRATATTLRNLRAVGTDTARQYAVTLIALGMGRCETWNDSEWDSGVLGARLSSWIGFYDFYGDATPEGFTPRLAENLQRQWKHLQRTLPAAPEGLSGLNVIRGLVYGSLNFATAEGELERVLGLACDLLRRLLAAEIFPDGAHRSRNPSLQLRFLQHLLDLRAVFTLAGLPFPEEASMAIATMTPVLKFYRHGDGALALFHGGREEASLIIDATLTQAEVRGRMPRRLTHGGFERISAGRSWLMADGGSPPVGGHAGLLAFEFGQGKERIIVNCGGYEEDGRAHEDHARAWHAAMAATAAHSTLTLDDTNAVEIDAQGGARNGVACDAQRYEDDRGHGLEMRHDGYGARENVAYQRVLELSPEGDTLRGREVLENLSTSNKPRGFAVRWHLHPKVQVALSHNGQTALLKTASGAGWRFRVEGATLTLEPSIYCGQGSPRRSLQIKAEGVTLTPQTVMSWTLMREKK